MLFITKRHSDPWVNGWLVGWLVYSYTEPPFGMQVCLGPQLGANPGPGSKLDLIGLARGPRVKSNP